MATERADPSSCNAETRELASAEIPDARASDSAATLVITSVDIPLIVVRIVPEKSASLFNASPISFKVSRAPDAPLVSVLIAESNSAARASDSTLMAFERATLSVVNAATRASDSTLMASERAVSSSAA